MWPFDKKIQAPSVAVEQQAVNTLAQAIKSLSGPAATPSWKINSPQVRTDWDFLTAVVEGYNVSAVVYACVEKRAKLLASVPWVAKRRNRNGDYEPAPDSELQRIIDRPNPDQSFYELMYNASQSLDLAGHAFISEIKAGRRNQPQELWYLNPHKMKIKQGRERLIDSYEYNNGTKHTIQADDMIMLKMPNPNSPIFGQPVLMAAGRATDIDRESGIWQKVSLENRGASDINIKLPEGATQQQVDSVKKQYKDQQAGAKNARKAMVTNAEIQMLGQTAVELDFVNSRKSVWTEICAVFGLSLSNLGMTEDVNLANAEAMDKALWKNTVIPQLELISRQLNHQLVSEFGDEYRLDYDLSNVEALQEDRKEKLEAAERLYRMGVPFNEINQRLDLGFDDIEGGNTGYIPSGMIPTSFDMPNDDPVTDESAEAQADAENADGE